jgi:hypothetical protein
MDREIILLIVGAIVVIGVAVSVIRTKARATKGGPSSKSVTHGPN